MVVWDWDLYRLVLLRVRNQRFRRVEREKESGRYCSCGYQAELKVLGCRC
jgi:hypothetical protein